VHGGSIEATVRYTTKHDVSTEHRLFRLVREGGIPKIADSQLVD